MFRISLENKTNINKIKLYNERRCNREKVTNECLGMEEMCFALVITKMMELLLIALLFFNC